MKMNKLTTLAFVAATLIGSTTANADLLYQYNSGNGTSAMISTFDAGNSVYLNIGHEGVSGKTHLIYSTYTPSSGYLYWNGIIPASAIETTGVNSMSINVDTCAVQATYACGVVDVTVIRDAASVPLLNSGLSQMMYGGILYQTAGSFTTYTADASGTVNGLSFSTTNRAWIGRYNNIAVTVSSGN